MQLSTLPIWVFLLCMGTFPLVAQIGPLSSDIRREVLRQGQGPQPSVGQEVKCHTTLLDERGNVISSSRQLNLPIYMVLDDRQSGFIREQFAAIAGMQRGAVHRFVIPKSYLAGRPNVDQLPGNSFVLEVELLDFGPPVPNGIDETMRRIQQQGVQSALSWFFSNNYNSAYTFREGDVNKLGYYLMQNNYLTEAVKVLEFNAQLHPNSCNAHDSLGDAYLKMGMADKARQEYQRALQIKPDFKPTQEKLANL